jgi:tetratricopeptide (TPR) repeat protein
MPELRTEQYPVEMRRTHWGADVQASPSEPTKPFYRWFTGRNVLAALVGVAIVSGGSLGVVRLLRVRDECLERAHQHSEAEARHLENQRRFLRMAAQSEAPPSDPALPDLSTLNDGRRLDSQLKEVLQWQSDLAKARGNTDERNRRYAARAAVYAAFHATLRQKYLSAAARPWLRVEPDPPPVEPWLRARYWIRRKDFQKARTAYEVAAQEEPNDPWTLNNLAWFLATCPESSVRDGAAAVDLATRATELSGRREPAILDTLAAALAETGDFKEAVKVQHEAMGRLSPIGFTEHEFEMHMRAYQKGRAYHESNHDAL